MAKVLANVPSRCKGYAIATSSRKGRGTMKNRNPIAGLDHFRAYVWSAVVAHNLVLFARLKLT